MAADIRHQRYRILLTTPAKFFIDSFLLGNGSTGGRCLRNPPPWSASISTQTRYGLAVPFPSRRSEGGAERLAALRAAVQRGDHLGAAAIDIQGDSWTQSCQPLGGLLWKYGPKRSGAYWRSLDLSEAISTTEYESESGIIRIESFTSAPDGVLVSTAKGPGSPRLTSRRLTQRRRWSIELKMAYIYCS